MVLEKVNAIADWRTLIGPTDARKAKITHPDRLLVLFLRLYIIVVLLFYRNILLCSIRAMCGEDLERNCVHGSDSRESAAREISFFFPHLLSGGTTLKHDEL
ncbi:putative nucleoside-diphosphate kinase [Helianthus annuus]|nr:putative nucleoside-diphosphate kinase [Helianthus annuus]